MCVGFLQTDDFKLPSFIVISVSKNGSELVDFSTVQVILECCLLKRFKN